MAVMACPKWSMKDTARVSRPFRFFDIYALANRHVIEPPMEYDRFPGFLKIPDQRRSPQYFCIIDARDFWARLLICALRKGRPWYQLQARQLTTISVEFSAEIAKRSSNVL